MNLRDVNATTQLIDVDITLPFPLDDRTSVVLSAALNTGNGWTPNYISVKEKNVCRALNTYVGEMWYDAERVAGIAMKQCPINPGHYRIRDYVIDFSKFKYPAVPSGKVRFRSTIFRDDKPMYCQDFVYIISQKN